ncbi:histidyl-tRNA synthetase [Owenweeksia hongkongensis DSM 17368]|uniref:Histidine--tRNA ligase n=1 Tax=Owenweeksia hongkongensis (strain DSM 17368 / CIP 108786 / JCM 12287 / NRRL B-23963 / UST20020801) TaxID=926562 RepID=G8R2Q6_OWEHD|nr:histidine--tRNA ligase [Owenweeksia hongkongensis]AEV31861.1 histidyl-tRNA synthetase [Owenweeksia hongkongensis DSM 17368]
MSVKPSLPKGTRDLLPEAMQKREYILSVLKEVFRKYGFLPIETPAMENLGTLTGKYGEEGDRLIFKILNSGDFIKKSNKDAFVADDSNAFGQSVSEKALRYDLTVPFARFVVQNQNDLHFPFKRFQIQPVWRADRPQKGRFREFYQCDADAVGSDSLLLELEFIRMYDEVFKTLGVDAAIHMNNRKLLGGLAAALGITERLGEFTIILDKLDKIGEEGVRKELDKNGFDPKVGDGLFEIIGATGSNEERLEVVSKLVSSTEVGAKGVEEAKFLLENLKQLNLKNEVVLDISLARGLDYYTGAIFEVKAKNVEMGSIGGGGRYDDLTGIFGIKNLSGIGISFGLDRIQIVMEELNLFTDEQVASTEVMFVNFGEKESLFSLTLANDLRDLGVKAEVYPDNAKMKKQLDFANKKNIPNVVMIGSQEMEAGKFSMKNMLSGEQKEYSRIELLEHFSTQKGNQYGRH